MAKKNKAKSRDAAKSRMPGKKVAKKTVKAKIAAAVEAKGVKSIKATKKPKAVEASLPSAADVAIKLGLPAPIAASKSIERIRPDPKNPRAFGHSDEMIAEMAQSLQSTGQLQPIGLVEDTKGKGYRLIWGHLRYLGAKKAGLKTLDARIFQALTDEQIAVAQAIENFTRTEPTALDEAMAVDRLTQGRAARQELTPEDVKRVAGLLGWHERRVRRCEKLLRLPADGVAAKLLAAGRLTIHQAESISTLADPKLQDDVADMAARNPDGSGGWSEYAVSRWVLDHRKNLRGVPWELHAEFAGKPACASCPNNAANKRGLFEDLVVKGEGFNERNKLDFGMGIGKDDVGMCLNESCFETKTRAAQQKIKAAVEKSKSRLVELTTSAKKNAKAGNYEFKPIAVTATTLDREKLIPDGIKPSTLVNQVRKVLPAGGRGDDDGDLNGLPKPNLVGKAGQGKKQADPREVAKQRHEQAKEKWDETLEMLLAQSLVAVPGRRSMLVMLMETKTWRDRLHAPAWMANERTEKKVETACKSPDIRALIGHLKEPTIAGLDTVEKGIPDTYTFGVGQGCERVKVEGLPRLIGDDLNEIAKPVLLLLLELLGVDAPPEPKLETFLAEVGDGAEAPAGGGLAKAKKGKGKKAKSNEEIGDEIDADGGAPEAGDE